MGIGEEKAASDGEGESESESDGEGEKRESGKSEKREGEEAPTVGAASLRPTLGSWFFGFESRSEAATARRASRQSAHAVAMPAQLQAASTAEEYRPGSQICTISTLPAKAPRANPANKRCRQLRPATNHKAETMK
jgi:hypothetical protein